jgi:hypothetical protein
MLAQAPVNADAVGAPLAHPAQPASRHASPPEMRVDVNHATLEDLLKVPGLTRTCAPTHPGLPALPDQALNPIAPKLNERGIQAPRGGCWHPNTVRRVLQPPIH